MRRFRRKKNSVRRPARRRRLPALQLVGPGKPQQARVELWVAAVALRRLPRGAAELVRLLQQQLAALQPRRVQVAQLTAAEQVRLAWQECQARPGPIRRSRKSR